jgi:hypothetical protein
MRAWILGATVAVTAVLLGACARPYLAPDERKQVCQFAIDEQFGVPVFKANPLASPEGVLLGALAGAGTIPAPFPLLIFTAPIGAAIGAAAGTACNAASLKHPTADADFARLLQAADVISLKRTLVTELHAPRAECARAVVDPASRTDPDAVVEIQKIEAGMACLLGQQEYWVAVQWRTRAVKTGKEFNWTTTKCAQTSIHSVDDWFADPDRARAEIEGVLAGTGRRMGAELLAQDALSAECKLHVGGAAERRVPDQTR